MTASEKSTHAFGTAFVSAVALAGFLLIFVEAGSFGAGARLFPRLLGLVGAMSAAVLLGQSCLRILAQRRHSAQRSTAGSALDWRNVVISYVGPPAYAGLLYLLGFWIASVLGLAGLLVLLGERRPLVVLAITTGTLLSIYLMFEFSFGIRMPEGVLLAA
jgi:hypothetical protein